MLSRVSLLLVVAAAIWARPAFADGCEQSPVLFAYQGSLFTVTVGQKPIKVASGLGQPYEIRWGPGCRRYAFIDTGRFWAAEVGGKPREAAIPGTAYSYTWSPVGNAVAVSAQRPACGGSPFPSNVTKPSVSDAYVIRLPELNVEAISEDCGTSVLGWSSDGRELALTRKPAHAPTCETETPVGEAVAPPCATADVVVWETETRHTKSVVTADQLNREHLEADTLVAWSPDAGALYLWSMVGWNGAGYLFAMDSGSGALLWRFRCESAADLGNGLIGVDQKVWVQKVEAMEWQSMVLDGRGRVLRKFPAASQAFDWSAPADLQPHFDGGRMEFTTDSGKVAWRYDLPEHFQWSQAEWIPGDQIAVVGWKGNLYPRELVVGLWLLDPTKKIGSELFEGTVPEANETASLAMLASGGAQLAAKGYSVRLVPPLVLATWPHAARTGNWGTRSAAVKRLERDASISGLGPD